MTVDGVTLHYEFIRAERHGHIHLAELPLHPRTPVQPHMAFLEPRLVPQLFQRLQYGLRTYPVSAVRVGEIPGHIYLMRPYLLQKGYYDIYVLLCPLAFLYTACLIERKIEEVGIGVRIQPERTDCRPCLRPADRALYVQQLPRLRFPTALGSDYPLHVVELIRKAELVGGIHMLQHHIVMHSHIAGCLICHMHVMSLLDEPYERTAHRNHVVVRVRGEDDDPLRERQRRHRPRAVICIRFSSRPPGDGMLQVIEHIYVYLVICPFLL